MLRCQDDARRAVNCVDACGENAYFLVRTFELKVDFRALGAADPVALHGHNAIRPTFFNLLEIVQQLIGVGRGLEEPLIQFLLLDRHGLMPPAAAVDYLLVSQHRAALVAPIHAALLAVGQALLPHLDEEPLVPAVVLRLARRDLAIPVVAEAEVAQLPLHVLDVGARPNAGIHLVLDGRVLRRQPKRIPTHRMQHTEAAHALVTRQRIADRIVPYVPHMQRAARVGQHLQHVILRLRSVCGRAVQPGVLPGLLPLGLNF